MCILEVIQNKIITFTRLKSLNKMKLSKLVFDTKKFAPSDAIVISHILLVRAGFIKRVSNGIYSLGMPAQRMANKIENIIREEMDRLEGQEVKFPVVMPKELWESSGRYNSIGSEMVRFKDRAEHDMVLGMTHEEAAVHFAQNTINSYQKLPFMIYQIQTKFRDEPRSRGGLIRVREFTMKDAYSFHMTQEDLERYYLLQYEAYNNIFKRIGMNNFISVKSDSGMMGGKVAHEFMAITNDGEDELVICSNCDYKANAEVAECAQDTFARKADLPIQEINTGKLTTIEEVSSHLGIDACDMIKAVVYAEKSTFEPVLVFIRGDLDVNESKLSKILKKEVVPLDSNNSSSICFGNIGPSNNLPVKKVIYDRSIANRNGMVVGANKPEYHIINFDVNRDVKIDIFYDVAKVKSGQKCPHCGSCLTIQRGIEIGNIFQLGTKYTQSMGMTVLNDKGESVYPIMGCYGIGIGRAIASIIQNSHDDNGMILPISVAPWVVHLCPIRVDNPEIKAQSEKLYNDLSSMGIETLLDDRDISAGAKFADADLMGMPIRLVISPKLLQNNEFEVKVRKTGEVIIIQKERLFEELNRIISALYLEIANTQ